MLDEELDRLNERSLTENTVILKDRSCLLFLQKFGHFAIVFLVCFQSVVGDPRLIVSNLILNFLVGHPRFFHSVVRHYSRDEWIANLAVDDRLQDRKDKEGLYLESKHLDPLRIELGEVNNYLREDVILNRLRHLDIVELTC